MSSTTLPPPSPPVRRGFGCVSPCCPPYRMSNAQRVLWPRRDSNPRYRLERANQRLSAGVGAATVGLPGPLRLAHSFGGPGSGMSTHLAAFAFRAGTAANCLCQLPLLERHHGRRSGSRHRWRGRSGPTHHAAACGAGTVRRHRRHRPLRPPNSSPSSTIVVAGRSSWTPTLLTQRRSSGS
jgi:hypothetical protein